jgi:hypothetical protein
MQTVAELEEEQKRLDMRLVELGEERKQLEVRLATNADDQFDVRAHKAVVDDARASHPDVVFSEFTCVTGLSEDLGKELGVCFVGDIQGSTKWKTSDEWHGYKWAGHSIQFTDGTQLDIKMGVLPYAVWGVGSGTPDTDIDVEFLDNILSQTEGEDLDALYHEQVEGMGRNALLAALVYYRANH